MNIPFYIPLPENIGRDGFDLVIGYINEMGAIEQQKLEGIIRHDSPPYLNLSRFRPPKRR